MNPKFKRRKPILCPLCMKGRIIDAADESNASHITLYGPHQSDLADWFSKCPKCGEQIGLTFRFN